MASTHFFGRHTLNKYIIRPGWNDDDKCLLKREQQKSNPPALPYDSDETISTMSKDDYDGNAIFTMVAAEFAAGFGRQRR